MSDMKGNKEKSKPESEAELNDLLEKEFNILDDKNNTGRIKSFLIDEQNDIQSKYVLILRLRLLIENSISECNKGENKKILIEKINIYVRLLFEIAQSDNLDLMVKSDLIFSLGMIGRTQYRQNFETSEDFIFKNLKKIFQKEKNEKIKNTIASIFWHFADIGKLSDQLKDDLIDLYNDSNGTVNDLLKAVKNTLGINNDKY